MSIVFGLERMHVLVAPGVSFNVPYRDHFRVTTLPDSAMMQKVFVRIEELLGEYVSSPQAARPTLVEARKRFK